jgi:hypothetical protein
MGQATHRFALLSVPGAILGVFWATERNATFGAMGLGQPATPEITKPAAVIAHSDILPQRRPT